MGPSQPNAVTGMPYTLVEIDEPKRPLPQRLQEAGSLEWKLWLQKYAWILSLATMAPGIALIAYTATGNLAFALAITALAVAAPAAVFLRRAKQLP